MKKILNREYLKKLAQRNGANLCVAMKKYGFVAGGAGNKRRRARKILLWALLALQIFLILCFWCLQTGYPKHMVNSSNVQTTNKLVNSSTVTMEKSKASPLKKAALSTKSLVNFVTKARENAVMPVIKDTQHKKFKKIFENTSNFTEDFVELKTYRLMNLTGIEAEIANDYNMETNVQCFRRGTLNDTTGFQLDWNADAQQVQCKCKQHWHGSDCGQNEVIYRALLLPRNQFVLRHVVKEKNAHLLVYILEGYFGSLDFLELQIKPMAKIVDQLLIIWRVKKQHGVGARKALKRKIHEFFKPERYILFECDTKSGCSRTDALNYFRDELKSKYGKRVRPTDLLLHTNENSLISVDVLRFFKYYAPAQLAPWRFRLKYNVYGFFWQHPYKTKLEGFLSSLIHLDDPMQLTKLLRHAYKVNEGLRIVGDLNHFAGWYCQYCAHPDEILVSLNHTPENVLPTAFANDKKQPQLTDDIQLPKNSRNNLVIDSKYLEYLIAQGLHIDGKTRLQKVRWNSDAYFAPTYAEKLKWKFGNLLTNLFEALDNEYVLDEAEGGFGF